MMSQIMDAGIIVNWFNAFFLTFIIICKLNIYLDTMSLLSYIIVMEIEK